MPSFAEPLGAPAGSTREPSVVVPPRRPTIVPATDRIPSLDGLRAFSICAVLLGHLGGTRGFPRVLTRLLHNDYVDIANLGVRVFFVISGYLITGLLIAETNRYGRIDLARFYLRRTFRIVPAYLALLVTVLVAAGLGLIAIHAGDVMHALTYTMNYHATRSWYVGHLWSLSVEEQFYLVWPALLIAVGIRRGLAAAALFVIAAPFVRLGTWYLAPGMAPLLGTSFETTGDAIAIGCLLAGWRGRLWANPRLQAALVSRWAVPALMLLGLALSARFRPALLIGVTVTNVAIALGIERCVRRSTESVGRVLNARPIVFVGTISYSLYLWQQLFINRESPAAVSAFPANLALACVLALVSYYAIERPMLRLRVGVERRFMPRPPSEPTASTTHDEAHERG